MNPFVKIDSAVQVLFDRASGYLDARGVVHPAVLREALVAEILGNALLSVTVLFQLSVGVGVLMLVVCLFMAIIGWVKWRAYNSDARNWNARIANNYAALALERRESRRESRLMSLAMFVAMLVAVVGFVAGGLAAVAGEAFFMLLGALALRSLTATCSLYAESTVPIPPPPPKAVPAAI